MSLEYDLRPAPVVKAYWLHLLDISPNDEILDPLYAVWDEPVHPVEWYEEDL